MKSKFIEQFKAKVDFFEKKLTTNKSDFFGCISLIITFRLALMERTYLSDAINDKIQKLLDLHELNILFRTHFLSNVECDSQELIHREFNELIEMVFSESYDNLKKILSIARHQFCYESKLEGINPLPFFSDVRYLSSILSDKPGDEVSEFTVCPCHPVCEGQDCCPWEDTTSWSMDIEDIHIPDAVRSPKEWFEHSGRVLKSPTAKKRECSSMKSESKRDSSSRFNPELSSQDSEFFLKHLQQMQESKSVPARMQATLSAGMPHLQRSTTFTYEKPSLCFPGSFFIPSETLQSPAFQEACIEKTLLREFFDSDSPLKNKVLELIDKCKVEPKRMTDGEIKLNPNTSYSILCKFNPVHNLFEIMVLNQREEALECFKGRDKYVMPGNYLFLIKPIPFWNYFIDCEGRFPIVRGWNIVTLHPDSPIFEQPNHSKIIKSDGFVPYSWGDAKIHVMPWKGLNLELFKSDAEEIKSILLATHLELEFDQKLIPDVKNFDFLKLLIKYMYYFCIKKDYKVYDIKPRNILYDIFTKEYSIIDFKSTGATYGFTVALPKDAQKFTEEFKSKYTESEEQRDIRIKALEKQKPNPVKMQKAKDQILTEEGESISTNLKICADAIVMTLFNLLDKDTVRLLSFHETFLSSYAPSTELSSDQIVFDQFRHYVFLAIHSIAPQSACSTLASNPVEHESQLKP